MTRRSHAALLFVAVVCLFPTQPASAGDSELERAKAAHGEAIKGLDDFLAQARRAHQHGVIAANRTLLAALDAAIADAERREDVEAIAALTRERDELAAKTPRPLSSLKGDEVFECVLGVYGRAIRGERQPFVNLRPPHRDLWSKEVQAAVNGKLSYDGLDYIATAGLVVPADGWYTVELPEAGVQFRLNGTLITGGDVELTRGVYDVELYTNTWGQPYLDFARAEVFKKGTTERLPLVNTGADIEEFLGQRIDGRLVAEVSGYVPKPVDVSLDGPKGKVKGLPLEERPFSPDDVKIDPRVIQRIRSER